MLGSIVNFFAGWQAKLAIVLIVLASLFAWHKHEVSLAVVQATSQMELEYAKEKFKLLDKANTETYALQARSEKLIERKNNEIKNATAQYANLLEWVRKLPANSTSSSDLPTNSNAEENRGSEVIGKLRRKDAENLANYSFRTEELKIELQLCYTTYEEVVKSLEKFRKENYGNIERSP